MYTCKAWRWRLNETNVLPLILCAIAVCSAFPRDTIQRGDNRYAETSDNHLAFGTTVDRNLYILHALHCFESFFSFFCQQKICVQVFLSVKSVGVSLQNSEWTYKCWSHLIYIGYTMYKTVKGLTIVHCAQFSQRGAQTLTQNNMLTFNSHFETKLSNQHVYNP